MKIRFSLLLLLCPEARTVLAFSSIHNQVSSSLRLWNSNNISASASVSFDYTKNNDQNNPLIHAFQSFATSRWAAISLSAAIMLLSFTFTSFVHPCYAEDTAVASDVPAFVTELGLKPPTDDKPQIRLSEGALNSAPAKSKARTPILQGLVYFPERVKDKTTETGVASISTSTPSKSKEPLDYYSDILVLTAVSAKDPNGLVLAGAKFPVSTVRFPFSFSMYEQNLLLKRDGVKETWEEVQNTSDVIIKAYICPGDAATFPCEDREVKKYSEGVAKLITKLPGLREGEVIRAPASLPL